MKKILIINGHPDKESFSYAISESYEAGAIEAGAKVKKINIRALKFNPNLQFGYRKRTELESDLIDAQEKIKWAQHLVWVYPVWWGSLPAMMKGFIDRVFYQVLLLRRERILFGGINTLRERRHV